MAIYESQILGIRLSFSQINKNKTFWVWDHNFSTCLAPQNDRLNFSFVKEILVCGEKMTRNGRKTAIYFESQILGIRLYIQ
jgi:hypothetical protein